METKLSKTTLMGDWKLQLTLAAVIGVFGIALATMGPTLATIVTFFWPLVVSTVFLLSAVTVLFRISPPPSDPDDAKVPGEELIRYVAGCHDEVSLEMTGRLDQVSHSQLEKGEGERRMEEESESVLLKQQEEGEERRGEESL